jgi:alpha-tubulin suppressor-like RCC1 family protein
VRATCCTQTFESRGEPVEIAKDSVEAIKKGWRFTAIAVGGNHQCALTEAGVAWCWGDHSAGQGGVGGGGLWGAMKQIAEFGAPQGQVWKEKPQRVKGELIFAAITAGNSHTCGLTREGKAYCWGWNVAGQLGIGSTDGRNAPSLVMAAVEP